MATGEVEEVLEVLKVLDSCIPRVKWRLRAAAKRRLETGPPLCSSAFSFCVFLSVFH